MNSRIKELWIEALKSGNYSQDKYSLRTYSGYCCLGVLCDIYAQEHNQEWSLNNDGYRFMYSDESLPQKVVNWAGLDSKTPYVGDVLLSELNDHGMSFSDIAEQIQVHL